MITAYGLEDRVELLGMLPHAELRKAYYEHHVFLAPSVKAPDGDSEGGAPITLVEAAATGMAIVSTWHDDIPEVIEHGRSGLLADEHDIYRLAEYLKTLALNREFIQELGTAAHARMRLHYDSIRQGERLSEIYKELLNL
jgi:colanic acid/amylovoran biosynthesis glycosyltransferase